jgi:tetratricopeptide (TPR) repeat protein
MTVLVEPPLVGRDGELDFLEAALKMAVKGKGSTIFVSGEAGSGKTRLINEFLDSSYKKQTTILRGWCLCNAAVPYFPFLEALDSHIEGSYKSGIRQSDLKKLLIADSPDFAVSDHSPLFPQLVKEQRFSAIAKELILLSTKRPLILFLDDLHWADSASLSLLSYVSGQINSERILILATFRTEEINQAIIGPINPLLDTLRLMGRQDLYKELKLPNLSLVDVEKIIHHMLGGEAERNVTEKLVDESQGNALFVIESVRMLFENGQLSYSDSKWRLVADKLGIPTKVKDIILRRLDALKPEQRRILDVASVIGDRFEPDLLGMVLNRDSLEVLEALNSIALSKSLVCVDGDYYKFDHAKSREVLYERILLPLRRGYHERVAERMESMQNETDKVLLADLAYHYTEAGNNPKSILYNLLSGKDALSRFSNAEAIEHFTYVIDKTAKISSNLNHRNEALEGLGSALVESGLQSRSIAVFEELFESGSSDLIKLRALRKAMWAATYQGDLVSVQRLALKSEGVPATDRLEHARVNLYLATTNLFGERRSKAIEHIELALDVFEKEGSVSDLGDALIEAAIIYGKAGKLEKSLCSGLRAQAIFNDKDDLSKMLVCGHLSYAYLACGLFKEALDTASQGINIGEKIDNPRTAWLCFFSAAAKDFLAMQFATTGRTLEAGQMTASAVSDNLKGITIAQKTDGYYILSAISTLLSREFITLGNLPKAEEYYSQYLKVRNNFGPLMEKALVPEGLSVKAAIHLAKGEFAQANGCYEEILAINKDNPDFSIFDAANHLVYGRALLIQKRFAEAQAQMQLGTGMIGQIAAKFENTNIQVKIFFPKNIELAKPFDATIELINISKKSAQLGNIGGFDSSKINVDSDPFESCILQPFSTKKIRFSLTPIVSGILKIEPSIVYLENNGQTRTLKLGAIALNVTSPALQSGITSPNSDQTDLRLNSEVARKALDFLVWAFKDDSTRKRTPLEQSGWRTLMDIAKGSRISKNSVYGSYGFRGQGISELERLGLVEVRAFTGERGRGGTIIKVRAVINDPNKK